MILGLVAAVALLPVPARAGAPTEQLRAAAEKVIQILDDPALQAEARALERQAAVRAAVMDLFDQRLRQKLATVEDVDGTPAAARK
jgi:hypothetical protein